MAMGTIFTGGVGVTIPRAIALGGLTIGVLDALDAIVFFGLRNGVPAVVTVLPLTGGGEALPTWTGTATPSRTGPRGRAAPASANCGTWPSERYSSKRLADSPSTAHESSATKARPAGSGRLVPRSK